MGSGLRCTEGLGMHLGCMRSICSSRSPAFVLHLMAAPIPEVLQKTTSSPLNRGLVFSGCQFRCCSWRLGRMVLLFSVIKDPPPAVIVNRLR
jgi:hypothetical protein